MLVELDPSETAADVAASEASLASYRAEARRRKVAILAAQSQPIVAHIDMDWPDEIPEANRQREDRVLNADLGQLLAQLASQTAQAEQKNAEHRRLEAMIAAQEALIATLQERGPCARN